MREVKYNTKKSKIEEQSNQSILKMHLDAGWLGKFFGNAKMLQFIYQAFLLFF